MKKTILAILVVSFLIPASAFAFFNLFGSHAPLKADNGVVSLPVADINDGNAHYYSFANNGKTIKFFVLKSKDGVLRAAFDACDVCYREKKGYSQKGDYMICNNCGQAFHSARINEVKGGCNPAPLAREVKGDQLVINASDIAAGARFF